MNPFTILEKFCVDVPGIVHKVRNVYGKIANDCCCHAVFISEADDHCVGFHQIKFPMMWTAFGRFLGSLH